MTAGAPPAGATVECRGLVHVYHVAGTDVAALRGVDLYAGAGERVALLGPSGSGKSTLLSVVAGLRRPSAGRVLIDGRDIARHNERELYRYRSGVGLMLQGALSNLLPYASAAENLRFATAGLRRTAAAEIGGSLLREAGLDDDPRRAVDLERADQQAVALAVAMARAPRLLLVDEPTSQLDDDARDRLLAILVRATAATGTTVLVVTHDEEVAARMQRMVRMREGRVGTEGARDRQYAVIGADGSVQLPEELVPHWPPGSTVDISAASPDELRILRRPVEAGRVNGSGPP